MAKLLYLHPLPPATVSRPDTAVDSDLEYLGIITHCGGNKDGDAGPPFR